MAKEVPSSLSTQYGSVSLHVCREFWNPVLSVLFMGCSCSLSSPLQYFQNVGNPELLSNTLNCGQLYPRKSSPLFLFSDKISFRIEPPSPITFMFHQLLCSFRLLYYLETKSGGNTHTPKAKNKTQQNKNHRHEEKPGTYFQFSQESNCSPVEKCNKYFLI